MVTRYFPIGYPVELDCSDEGVRRAADDSWGRWDQLFCAPALRVHVEVIPGAGDVKAPSFMGAPGELRLISDAADWAVYSFDESRGYIRIRDAVVRQTDHFRYHYLDALVLTALGCTYFTPLHAACVSREGRGVLLCGDSGAGKSSLAYGCAKAGWTLTSDDAVYYAGGRNRLAVGRPWFVNLRPAAKDLFDEIATIDEHLAQNGKPVIRVSTDGLETAALASVATCVLLDRSAGPAELTAIPAEAAVAYFEKTLGFTDLRMHRPQLEVVAASGVKRLCYQRLEDAIDLLGEL